MSRVVTPREWWERTTAEAASLEFGVCEMAKCERTMDDAWRRSTAAKLLYRHRRLGCLLLDASRARALTAMERAWVCDVLDACAELVARLGCSHSPVVGRGRALGWGLSN